MGAASSLLNSSRRRPAKYHAAKPPAIRTTGIRIGAILGGRRLGRATGDSVVGPVTWARRKGVIRGYKDNAAQERGHGPSVGSKASASFCIFCSSVPFSPGLRVRFCKNVRNLLRNMQNMLDSAFGRPYTQAKGTSQAQTRTLCTALSVSIPILVVSETEACLRSNRLVLGPSSPCAG